MKEFKGRFDPCGELMEIYNKPMPLSQEDLQEIVRLGPDAGIFVFEEEPKLEEEDSEAIST